MALVNDDRIALCDFCTKNAKYESFSKWQKMGKSAA